jgi:hypothetical protein
VACTPLQQFARGVAALDNLTGAVGHIELITLKRDHRDA